MKQNSFFKHFMIIGSGAVINMFIGLFTTPLITRIVDPSNYGRVSIFNTYANILMMVVSLGLDQALVRFFYQHDDKNYKRKLLYICWFWPSIALLIGSLIVGIYLIFAGDISSVSNTYLFVAFVIMVFVLLVNRFSLLILRLNKKSKTYSWMNILHKLLYVLLTLVILSISNYNDFHILIFTTIISYTVPSVIAIVAEHKIWNPFFIKYTEKIEYKTLIQYGIPLLVANGIYMIFQAIDKISLSYFCTYEVVGVYASAMSLMSIIAIIRATFNTIWAPASVEHYEKNPDEKTFYQKGNRYITVIMFAFGITLMLCKDLIAFLLGEKYRAAAMIMPFLIFQPIMYTISETTVVGIYFKKKSYAQLIISIASCVFNIIGNLILIPLVGAKGAAISTGLSYILFFTLRTAFSNKYYYVDFGLKKFYFATLLTMLFALYNTFVPFGTMTVILYIALMAIGYVLYNKTIKELILTIIDKIPMLKKRGKDNV